MANHTVASGNFLVPNATFIVELILFVIVLGVVARFIVPPTQQALRERQAIIDGQANDSAEAGTKQAEAEAEYQGALDDARSQAAQIRENARTEAQHTTDELRTQAQQQSASSIAEGEQQLAAQRESVVRELRGEIGSLALDLSEKIIGQPLSGDTRVQATVAAYLAELDSRSPADRVGGQA